MIERSNHQEVVSQFNKVSSIICGVPHDPVLIIERPKKDDKDHIYLVLSEGILDGGLFPRSGGVIYEIEHPSPIINIQMALKLSFVAKKIWDPFFCTQTDMDPISNLPHGPFLHELLTICSPKRN